MKRFIVALLALAACASDEPRRDIPAPDAGVAISGYGPRPEEWSAVRVSVRAAPLAPESPTLKSVGKLVFRGGLELASDDARFGGLSGLYIEDDQLLAVSDQGHWFAARLVFSDSGELTGLADPRLAMMRGETGDPLERQEADAEDLTRLPDGRFAVSFEQIHRVRLYDLAKKGPFVGPDATITLSGTQSLGDNDSLEAMASYDDKLLIGAEGLRDRGAPFWITPVSASAPATPAGTVPTQEGFGLVALARLPDGDFVAMERFFAPLIGPRIYLRRVTAAGLASTPARWEGEKIAELTPPVALDNFEGLAIVAGAERPRVYIVSDDNFSRSQKTLLYAFDLEP